MSNIYGGRTYEGTCFIFDKIYSNYNEMINDISNIFIGRYVLIKYCDTAFDFSKRADIEEGNYIQNTDEEIYYNNYRIDKNKGLISDSADRKVYMAAWNNGIIPKEITNLRIDGAIDDSNINTIIQNQVGAPNGLAGLDENKKISQENLPESISGVGETTEQNGEIFNDYSSNQAVSQFSSARGTNNIAGQKGFPIGGVYENSVVLQFITLSDIAGLSVGDIVSFVCKIHLYNNKTIQSITYDPDSGDEGVRITFTESFTESELSQFEGISDPSDYYACVLAKPSVGIEDIGTNAYVEGMNNHAVLSSTHAEGSTNIALGEYSHVEGRGCKALRQQSHAEGRNTTANGVAAHAEGLNTQALSARSHAEGSDTIADGSYGAHAEGYKSKAYGNHSHAEGYDTLTKGTAAHTEGYQTQATNSCSHAEGHQSKAMGDHSHAEGNKSEARGSGSHAEGVETKAFGADSHTEGFHTEAYSQADHAEGYRTTAFANYIYGGAHVEGSSGSQAMEHITTETSNEDIVTIWQGVDTQYKFSLAKGTGAHAEGKGILALGGGTHAEGCNTIAQGGSEGGAHAEGRFTVANGSCAHAEGQQSQALNTAAHAEGSMTKATGEAAHAEGRKTLASGKYSHAAGAGTIASADYQYVIGKYNKENSDALFIVGNGTGTNSWQKSNAFEVLNDGTAMLGEASVITTNTLSNVAAEQGFVHSEDIPAIIETHEILTSGYIMFGTSETPPSDLPDNCRIYIQIGE